MDKIQRTLFDDDERKPAGSLRVILKPKPNRPLTKAQRTFNRLVSQVEELRRKLECSTETLNKALVFYQEHILPRRRRCGAVRKDIVRLLAPFLKPGRLKEKRDRKTFRNFIAGQLDSILDETGPIEEEDLKALFNQVYGSSYEEIEKQESDQMRSVMESMFADFGIDIDLSDFGPGMTDEEAAVKMAEMSDRMEKQLEEDTESSPEQGRPKSKRQLNEEERIRKAEEIRKKSITSIYRQLAKALHPDLEPDESHRQRKVALMQELTEAYRNGDMHTLLRLECEWIGGETGNLEQLTDEKLAVYNQMLKEQVVDLKMEIEDLPLHPKYGPIVDMSDPFTVRVRTDGSSEVRLLDTMIRDMEDSLATLRLNPAKEVHAVLRAYRAEERARKRELDRDFPF